MWDADVVHTAGTGSRWTTDTVDANICLIYDFKKGFCTNFSSPEEEYLIPSQRLNSQWIKFVVLKITSVCKHHA